MFGLGLWEFAVILLVALVVLGPEKLPKVARTLGRGVRELRKAMQEFQTHISTADINPPPRTTAPPTAPPTAKVAHGQPFDGVNDADNAETREAAPLPARAAVAPDHAPPERDANAANNGDSAADKSHAGDSTEAP